MQKFGAAYNADGPEIEANSSELKVDKTYKLYYGGAQKRPDGNYSKIIRNPEGKMIAQVGQANRKDVRNAVEAALKAQPGWEKRSGFNRAQILFYFAENLEMRKEELAERIAEMCGKSLDDSSKEILNLQS